MGDSRIDVPLLHVQELIRVFYEGLDTAFPKDERVKCSSDFGVNVVPNRPWPKGRLLVVIE